TPIFRFEVGLFEIAARRIAATRDRKQVVDRAIRAAIGIDDESRFEHGAIALKKRRNEVHGTGDKGALELRITRRAGAADVGRRVATAAVLKIEGGTESRRVRIANAAIDRM